MNTPINGLAPDQHNINLERKVLAKLPRRQQPPKQANPRAERGNAIANGTAPFAELAFSGNVSKARTVAFDTVSPRADGSDVKK